MSRDMHYKNLEVILLVLAFFIRYFFRTINLIQLGLFCLPSNWNTIFLNFEMNYEDEAGPLSCLVLPTALINLVQSQLYQKFTKF